MDCLCHYGNYVLCSARPCHLMCKYVKQQMLQMGRGREVVASSGLISSSDSSILTKPNKEPLKHILIIFLLLSEVQLS